MKRIPIILFISFLLLNLANAQIVNHAWPKESELISNEKYEIKARVYDPASQFSGEWVALDVFLSIPRDYPTHWKLQDDAMTDFMKDRTLSFVSFDFEGYIEVEVTQKLSSKNAEKVELSPKAFGFNPHYFDGKTVRFYMDRPEYVSVNFDFGKSDNSINRDDNRASGLDIKHGCMIFTETPEKKITDYTVPKPGDPGVVVWDNNTDLATILNASIIYFPPGEHEMRNHKDRWERNSSWDFAERAGNWVTTKAEYDNAKLYRGRLKLSKNDQKVYIAPGAIVYGGFHSSGKTNNWLYGRGIVTGRKHLMHEIIMPESNKPIAIDSPYEKVTKTKEAFCHYGNGAVYDGVLFLEAWHHTCPSGSNSKIRRTKIIGWCSNNDGIRPGGGSIVDRIFVKTSDDIDYARDKKVVRNAVFWPMVNGAMGMLGWNNLGSGYAEYYNTYVINSEWHLDNPSKGNIGIVGGGMAKAGIKLSNNIYQDFHIENRTNYLVLVALSGSGTGFLRNFKLKNITTEYPLSNATGKTVKQELKGVSSTWVENWTFTNVFIDGVLLTWENHKNYFNLNLTGTNGTNTDEARKVKNITFNSEGEIFNITHSSNAGGAILPKGDNNVIQVAAGMDMPVSIIPDNGYRIKKITIDGNVIYEYGSDVLIQRKQAWTFENITANHSIEAEFEQGMDFFNLAFCADTIPPTQPANLELTESNIRSVSVKWDASTDNETVAGYNVYVDGQLHSSVPSNSALIGNLKCETEYLVEVTAVDICSNQSVFSAPLIVKTSECDTIPPSIPIVFVDKVSAGSISILGFPSTDNDAIAGYEVYLNDSLYMVVETLSATIENLVCETVYSIKVRAFDFSGNYSGFSSTINENTDVCGSFSIPGKIEAEGFNSQSGIEIQATSDTGGGSNIGFINNDDWVSYLVDVTIAGKYNFDFRVASNNNGGEIELYADEVLLGSIQVPGTGGWQSWVTLSEMFTLKEGKQTLKLLFKGTTGFLFNMNWFEADLTTLTSHRSSNEKYRVVSPIMNNEPIIIFTGNINQKISSLALFDLTGRLVFERKIGYAPNHYLEVPFKGEKLNGLYLVVIKGEDFRDVNRLLVVE